MDEGDEQNLFVVDEVSSIIKQAIEDTIGGNTYQQNKVNMWTTQVVDTVLQSLAKLNKPFKYIDKMVSWCPQSYFVDKSKVVKAFLRCHHKVIMVSAPQGFLKTTNMHMIGTFIDGLSDIAVIERRKRLWADMGLRIMKEVDLVNEYFGQWPYVHMTLSICGSSNVMESLIEKICGQYKHYETVLTSDRLSAAQKANFRIYRNYSYKSVGVGERKVADALVTLCDVLHSYSGKQVFVFIDNYDFLLLEALAKERPLLNVQPFLARMLYGLSHSKAVKKVLLNGITSFTGGDGADVSVYRFLDDHRFTKYYGFTEDDVLYLVNTNRCSSEITKHILSHNYTTLASSRLYSPEWVLDYLKHNAAADNPIWFEEILRKPVMTMVSMRNRLVPLEKGEGAKANVSKLSRHSDLLQLNRLLNGSMIDLEDEEVDLVMNLLFEFGLFTFDVPAVALSCSCLAQNSAKKLRMSNTSRMASGLRSLSSQSSL